MRSSDFIKIGIKNLWRRKLRTILTIVGVAIGAFAIVVMVSLGIAMSESYKNQIMQMGSLTTINVSKYYYSNEAMEKGNYKPPKEQTLDDNLVKKIKQIPHVQSSTPIAYMSAKLISGRYEAWTQLKGLDPNAIPYFEFPELAEGRMLNENDASEILVTENACYFYNPNQSGYRRYDNTDSPVDVMNDKIQMTFDMGVGEEAVMPTYYKFKPIGKLIESRGDKGGVLYVNIEQILKWKKELKKAGVKTYDDDGYSEVWVSVDDIKYVEQVQDEIESMGYGTSSLADMLKPMQETANTLQLILGGIGAVSLLVSAIGIANTMIMSIYERTKEIGVMKVLGCLISDIKKLFLFEAGMIGLIGGILGIGLSYLASYLLNKYGSEIGTVLGGAGIGSGSKISVIPIWLVAIALGFSMLVGLLSGYYPARRATRIKALEAIRESN